MRDNDDSDYRRMRRWILGTIGGAIFIAAVLTIGCPPYNVWTAKLAGEAELSHAESARRIQITQAGAEREAAQLRADAIAIVGKAATDFPAYRQQEFIGAFAEALKEGKITQIMYIPTEANIPIIEAGRHPLPKKE